MRLIHQLAKSRRVSVVLPGKKKSENHYLADMPIPCILLFVKPVIHINYAVMDTLTINYYPTLIGTLKKDLKPALNRLIFVTVAQS